ncbi:MAG: glycosyltransferase, partial [Bacteroidales bacterium]|nr:glycosyltransferase [Bacteroidales bacterium]
QHKFYVIFTGRLELEELRHVLGGAMALVFIPYFEGFGIPLVEAMYAETAIISGDTTSLPEVVGDAALVCSPQDHKKVAENMEMIANDEKLRQSLIAKGRIQREKFSWDKSANRFWRCIEKGIEKVQIDKNA